MIQPCNSTPYTRRQRGTLLVAVAVIVLGVLPVTGCQSASTEHDTAADGDRVHGRYIVEMERPQGAEELLREALADWSPRGIQRLETERTLYLVRLGDDPGASAVRDRMTELQGVVDIQPEYRYQGTDDKGGSSPGSSYE